MARPLEAALALTVWLLMAAVAAVLIFGPPTAPRGHPEFDEVIVAPARHVRTARHQG